MAMATEKLLTIAVFPSSSSSSTSTSTSTSTIRSRLHLPSRSSGIFPKDAPKTISARGFPGGKNSPVVSLDNQVKGNVGSSNNNLTAAQLVEMFNNGQLEDALDIMEQQGVQVDLGTCRFLVRVCGNVKALEEGKRIHDYIVRSGLDSDEVLGNHLIEMYRKCGKVFAARQTFNEMPHRSIVSWTSMIATYVHHGQRKEAFQLFFKMRQQSLRPNRVTFLALLDGCTRSDALSFGKLVHSFILDSGFNGDGVVETSLLCMYSRCGSIGDAGAVFDGMIERNVVSWTAIIAAYVQRVLGNEALLLFEGMHEEGISPNKFTFVNALNACSSPEVLEDGRLIHEEIRKRGLEYDVVVGTALVNMYDKCGSLENARAVFDQIRIKDVIAWTAMICAYARCKGQSRKALQLFRQMHLEGIMPNKVTFICILDACNNQSDFELAKLLHHAIVENGFESDSLVATSLMKMYSRCGSLEEANGVFVRIPIKDVVSWTAMIATYVQHGFGQKAIELFKEMFLEGMEPTKQTFVSILDACASARDLALGERIIELIPKCGLACDGIVGAAIINMFARCGNLKAAREVFDKMQDKTNLGWIAMLRGYAEQGQGREAFRIFQQMQEQGFVPEKTACLIVLDACVGALNLAEGCLIHACIVDNRFGQDVNLGNALISMYGKCGSLKEAKRIFDNMCEPNILSWNIMMSTYVQHGHTKAVLQSLQKMQRMGIQPDKDTFINILFACSDEGFMDEGCHHFVSESSIITPKEDHYTCLIGLVGQVGWVDEAEDIIRRMPYQPNIPCWITLLEACIIYGNLRVGGCAAKQILELDVENASACMLFTNNTECKEGHVSTWEKCSQNKMGFLGFNLLQRCMTDKKVDMPFHLPNLVAV